MGEVRITIKQESYYSNYDSIFRKDERSIELSDDAIEYGDDDRDDIDF